MSILGPLTPNFHAAVPVNSQVTVTHFPAAPPSPPPPSAFLTPPKPYPGSLPPGPGVGGAFMMNLKRASTPQLEQQRDQLRQQLAFANYMHHPGAQAIQGRLSAVESELTRRSDRAAMQNRFQLQRQVPKMSTQQLESARGRESVALMIAQFTHNEPAAREAKARMGIIDGELNKRTESLLSQLSKALKPIGDNDLLSQESRLGAQLKKVLEDLEAMSGQLSGAALPSFGMVVEERDRRGLKSPFASMDDARFYK